MNRIPIIYSFPKRLVINRAELRRLKEPWTFPPEILAIAKDVSEPDAS